jgi:hypothetical protein
VVFVTENFKRARNSARRAERRSTAGCCLEQQAGELARNNDKKELKGKEQIPTPCGPRK